MTKSLDIRIEAEIDRLLRLPKEQLMDYVGLGGEFELGPQHNAPRAALGILLGPRGGFIRFLRLLRAGDDFVPAEKLSKDEYLRWQIVGWFDGGVSTEDYGVAAEALGIALPEDPSDLDTEPHQRIRALLGTWTIENHGRNAFRVVFRS